METLPSAELPATEVEGGLAASPDSITELFDREDPGEWDEATMNRMIAEIRAKRKDLETAAAKSAGKSKAKPKKAPLDAGSGADLLKSLGL